MVDVVVTFVFVDTLNLLSIVPFEKDIWKYLLFPKNLVLTFETAPLAVGFAREFWYILNPTNFTGSPDKTSTTISSVTSQSASDGDNVCSKGLIISTFSPYKTWNKIFNEVSVPFEM